MTKPWTKEKQFLLEKMLNDMIRNMKRIENSMRRRKKRDTTSDLFGDDYGNCKVHVSLVAETGVVAVSMDCSVSDQSKGGNKTTLPLPKNSLKKICTGIL